ncbi:MAG: SdiA-regulated domain-containing protein [Thermoanaerobaculia bacterium]
MNSKGIAAIALTLLGGLAARAGSAQTLTYVSTANITQANPGFYEASGLGTAKNQTSLWSIGDGALTVYKMYLDGSSNESFLPTPINSQSTVTDTDFEGITYAPPPPGNSDDHFIYVANEGAQAILPVNYSTQKYYAQASLASMAGYTTVNCVGGGKVSTELHGTGTNSGLEGITWNGNLNSFFVIQEKSPGLMIKISADLTTITACRVLTFSGADYSDISYDSTRGLFWIVSDEAQKLYLYNWSNGTVTKNWSLPYAHAEGVAFNPGDSRLYIATDNGGGSDSYLYTYSVQ